MSETTLVTEVLHGHIACWTLNRPQQLNALNGALIDALEKWSTTYNSGMKSGVLS